jgi:uncharacterized cofD-like protein
MGPGSLYTSILPNLLVPDLVAAVRSSRAVKVYVCNIATQKGETDLYTCHDHARSLEEHIGSGMFDILLCNENQAGDLGPAAQWVRVDERSRADPRYYGADLIDDDHPWRHDPVKLSQVLLDLYFERTGPLG